MKRSVLIIIVSVLVFASLNSETITLEEVLSPDSIFVSSDRIYITEGATIHIYSKSDKKYLGKFGKKGEGPGEINASRRGGLSFGLNIVKNNLFIHNRSKVMFFDKAGKFLKEKKLTGGFIRGLIPVGDNFVARSFKIGENRSRTQSLTIYDKNFKKISEVAGRSNVEFTRGSFVKIYFDANIFNIRAHKGIIYLNSSRDFVIERYSDKGKNITPIKLDYKLMNVSGARKDRIKSYFKNDSRFSGFWERIKDMFEVADQYPAIKKLFITGNRIYAQTFKRTDSGDEFYILDLKGKVLNRMYIAVGAKNILEDYPYFIENRTSYILNENEDEEEWELTVTNI
ncbi:MAG: hypothetical protein ABFR36_00095 [Acidobacteriota bacterium]